MMDRAASLRCTAILLNIAIITGCCRGQRNRPNCFSPSSLLLVSTRAAVSALTGSVFQNCLSQWIGRLRRCVCVCVCDTLPVSRLIGRRVSRRSATKLSLQLTRWLLSVAAEFDWKPSRFSLLKFCNHADRKCNNRIMFGINTCSFIFH